MMAGFFTAVVVFAFIPTSAPFDLALRLVSSPLGHMGPPALAARPPARFLAHRQTARTQMQISPGEDGPEPPRYEGFCILPYALVVVVYEGFCIFLYAFVVVVFGSQPIVPAHAEN